MLITHEKRENSPKNFSTMVLTFCPLWWSQPPQTQLNSTTTRRWHTRGKKLEHEHEHEFIQPQQQQYR